MSKSIQISAASKKAPRAITIEFFPKKAPHKERWLFTEIFSKGERRGWGVGGVFARSCPGGWHPESEFPVLISKGVPKSQTGRLADKGSSVRLVKQGRPFEPRVVQIKNEKGTTGVGRRRPENYPRPRLRPSGFVTRPSELTEVLSANTV